MKTFLFIMIIVCIATFLGLVVAALAAKDHQHSGKRTKFRFSLAFMDLTFFFVAVLTIISLGGGKHLVWSHLAIFTIVLGMTAFCFSKWERKA